MQDLIQYEFASEGRKPGKARKIRCLIPLSHLGCGIAALDGKTLRRSFEHSWDKSGLHLVTAWCV
jgi:hypothetical protein